MCSLEGPELHRTMVDMWRSAELITEAPPPPRLLAPHVEMPSMGRPCTVRPLGRFQLRSWCRGHGMETR